MKSLWRGLTLLAAWLGLLSNMKLPHGQLRLLSGLPKFFAGPLAFFIAAGGLVGAARGLLRRDWLSLAAGAAAAWLARQHILKVTAPHDEFAFAFGPDWEQRIPHHLRWRLRSQRYTVRPLAPPAVPVVHDYVIGCHYETGAPLLADIWQPPDSVPRSGMGLIYLHGSGWHYMDKDYQGVTRPWFKYLAGQGHLVADVAYTLAPEASLLPMVADVKRAIAWMKSNADSLQVNPERIVLMGGSAGAHLALLAAYTPNHSLLDPADVAESDTAVHGVISLYGISDMVRAHAGLTRLAPMPGRLHPLLGQLCRRLALLPGDGRYVDAHDMIPNILGGLPQAEAVMYDLASPITHVGPHCPPTLLLNGTHDLALDVDQHRLLHATLYRHHVPCVHVELDTADHAFDLAAPRWSPAGQAALYDMERFLALLL